MKFSIADVPMLSTAFRIAFMIIVVPGCGKGSDIAIIGEVHACPAADAEFASLSDELEGSERAAAAAAIAPFESVLVEVPDAASLALDGAELDLSPDDATWSLSALSACSGGAYAGRADLALGGDGSQWSEDGANGGTPSSLAVVDETTGEGYYSAILFRTWAGGAPLDAFGVVAGDELALTVTYNAAQEASGQVAEGSSVDAASAHWTLWRASEAGGDPQEKLASGPVTFVSPQLPTP